MAKRTKAVKSSVKVPRATKPAKPQPVSKPAVPQRTLPDDGLSSAFHSPPVSLPAGPAVAMPVPGASPPAADRSKGLVCRKCGCRHFYTRNTLETESGIKRYRECRHCGRIVTTFERAV